MNIENIQGLDTEAWERWVAYRKAIRKPLKEISLHAAALKLAKYGADQSEVVSQSISNQWQGLFELKKSKPMPGEKVEKTDIRLAEPKKVLGDPHIRSMVWQLFGERGFNRLKSLANGTA
jgi:hypothetical protein